MTTRWTCDVCGAPMDEERVRGQCCLHYVDGADVTITLEFPLTMSRQSQKHVCRECIQAAERALQGQADRYNDER